MSWFLPQIIVRDYSNWLTTSLKIQYDDVQPCNLLAVRAFKISFLNNLFWWAVYVFAFNLNK